MGVFNTNQLNSKEKRNVAYDKADQSWKLLHTLKRYGSGNVIINNNQLGLLNLAIR